MSERKTIYLCLAHMSEEGWEQKYVKKVYVQDINSEAVILSLRAVLPTDHTVDVVPVKNCEQFYLPAEL